MVALIENNWNSLMKVILLISKPYSHSKGSFKIQDFETDHL